jgi:hypothetical protein
MTWCRCQKTTHLLRKEVFMTNHTLLLGFLATPGVQTSFQAWPGRAFVSDITFPAGLPSAKLYVSARAPLFQPSAWWAPLRGAGFQPTPAQAGRFLAALRACGATGALPWNVQATWDAGTTRWTDQVKIYLQCEHLPVLDAGTLAQIWAALGADGALARLAAGDGAGQRIEGVAATIGPDGVPLVLETYLQGEGTGHDCVSVERSPDGTLTTCRYTHLGSACTPELLARNLCVDAGTMVAVCSLLPDPNPSAVAVAKSTPGRPDAHGVCVQTTPARPGMDL